MFLLCARAACRLRPGGAQEHSTGEEHRSTGAQWQYPRCAMGAPRASAFGPNPFQTPAPANVAYALARGLLTERRGAAEEAARIRGAAVVLLRQAVAGGVPPRSSTRSRSRNQELKVAMPYYARIIKADNVFKRKGPCMDNVEGADDSFAGEL